MVQHLIIYHAPFPLPLILVCRLADEAVTKRKSTAAALFLQKAAQLDPSGNISARQQLASQLAALRQQQQQDVSRAGGSQQQAVKVDVDIDAPKKLIEIEEMLFGTTPREHAPTLVGRWCAAFDALTLAWMRLPAPVGLGPSGVGPCLLGAVNERLVWGWGGGWGGGLL
jgi:hypothetical protein